MHRNAIFRRHRRGSCQGFAAVIPLAIAVFFSVMLMSACHSPSTQFATSPDTRPTNASVAPHAMAATSAANDAPLSTTLFDEHFYTPPSDDSDDDASAS